MPDEILENIWQLTRTVRSAFQSSVSSRNTLQVQNQTVHLVLAKNFEYTAFNQQISQIVLTFLDYIEACSEIVWNSSVMFFGIMFVNR